MLQVSGYFVPQQRIFSVVISRTKPKSSLYALLSPWVRMGAVLFFRKIRIVGLENIPADSPVILVANHQNAMLDPVILCVTMERQLHWLTRADVFRNKGVGTILLKLNMLPVYRDRDKVNAPDWNARNEKVFQNCFDRLRAGAVIALFPEGTHRGKKQLHLPIKKGVVRLAFGACRAGIDKSALCVVPVGLDYSDYYHPRGELLIRIGEPVFAGQYLDLYGGDEVRAGQAMLSAIHSGLSNEMIDIRDGHHYDDIIGIQSLCHRLAASDSLNERFEYYRKTTSYLNQHASKEDLEAIHTYVKLTRSLSLDEREFEWRDPLFLSSAFLILVWPLFAIAAVIFSPMRIFVEWVVTSKVRDPLFNNSVRMSLWTFLTPVWLIVLGILTGVMCGSATAGLKGVLIAGLSGLAALAWQDLFRRYRRFRQVRNVRIAEPAAYSQWLNARKELIRKIQLWNASE